MGFWMARSRKCGGKAVVGALAFLLTAASAAEAVQVSLPSNATITSIGQTTVVNISIGSVTNVEALGLSITYSEGIADVLTTGAVQRGPLTTNCDSTVINVTEPGRLTLTAACATTPITGSGTLFSVTFTGTGNGVTPLTFSTFMANNVVLIPNGCLLNEGNPTCEPVNGQLTVGAAQPTSTASNTPLATATRTRTNTATATATNTVAGNTPTATNTALPANTNTATVTRTGAATATNTPPATSTATRTRTATVTDTPTTGPSPTASNTATITQTPSVTLTPSITGTATQTFTPSPTGTVTQTRTVTNTPPPTTTRAGIPVVPSPASPAGVAMVSGLGVALLWALRRLQRPR